MLCASLAVRFDRCSSFGDGNYLGPDAEQAWAWGAPGALVAAILWLAASLAFKLYVANFTDYNAAYGTVGGVIVLLLWFYVSSLAILFGAEMNAEIEHASQEVMREERAAGAGQDAVRAAPISAGRPHDAGHASEPH